MSLAAEADAEPATPRTPVGLSTASVYPESTATAFELAGRLGYDAVEVMVGMDPVSQDVDALKHLVDYHQLPVGAIHAPCLLITQRVWGTEPWAKLEQSAAAAKALGAELVVVHPPFRWQRGYADGFAEGIRRLEKDTGVRFGVENMYPWRAAGREFAGYAPSWDVMEQDHDNVVLDLSHTAISGSDPLAMAEQLGDRLAQVHLADGSGSGKDEHLVPGRGSQPCAELLHYLVERRFPGSVVVEISTRRAADRTERETDLVESLEFARRHLAPRGPSYAVAADGTVTPVPARGR